MCGRYATQQQTLQLAHDRTFAIEIARETKDFKAFFDILKMRLKQGDSIFNYQFSIKIKDYGNY